MTSKLYKPVSVPPKSGREVTWQLPGVGILGWVEVEVDQLMSGEIIFSEDTTSGKGGCEAKMLPNGKFTVFLEQVLWCED